MPKAPVKKREITVVERRLQSGSIFAASSQPIPLKEPQKWSIRVVDATISPNRVWEMQANKGWVYLTPEDLAVEPHEVGFRVQDGRVVRGQHGTEVLMKMLKRDYVEVQLAKDAENRKNTFGSKAVRDSVLGAVAQEPGGDQGAAFLERHLQGITVTDSREVVSLEE